MQPITIDFCLTINCLFAANNYTIELLGSTAASSISLLTQFSVLVSTDSIYIEPEDFSIISVSEVSPTPIGNIQQPTIPSPANTGFSYLSICSVSMSILTFILIRNYETSPNISNCNNSSGSHSWCFHIYDWFDGMVSTKEERCKLTN
jgi:hypothetical protein